MANRILSFCIPTYNRSAIIYECVTHILQHPSNEFEVVVSDNASSDDTIERLSTIKDPRLRVSRNPENLGLIANTGIAVNMSRGKYALTLTDEDRILLDNIDEAIYFLRNLKEEYALIRFGMLGAVDMHSKDVMRVPAGPWCTCIALTELFDVAGTAYNRSVIRNIEITEASIIRAHEWVAKQNPESYLSFSKFVVKYTKDYPICYSNVLLINRREVVHAYKEELTLYKDIEDGYSTMGQTLESFVKTFDPIIDIVQELYKDTELENYTYLFLVKRLIIEMGYFTAISFFLPNRFFMNKYNDPILRMRYCEKWGTPWDAMSHSLREVLELLYKKTGYTLWDSVLTLCDAFLDNNLDMPVDGFTDDEKEIAGEIIYRMGTRSTDTMYVPNHVPAFYSAEFLETNDLYLRLCNGLEDVLLQYPELHTKRDYYLRGEAYFKRDDLGMAKKCFGIFLDSYQNAETLRHTINGSRGKVLALLRLGLISWLEGDCILALKYLGDASSAQKKYFVPVKTNVLSEMGYELHPTKSKRNYLKEYNDKRHARKYYREMNAAFKCEPETIATEAAGRKNV